MTVNELISRLISRKFLLAMFSQAANVSLCWAGKIDPGVFATVTALTVGGYITGNVVQKATAKETGP
jgi:hypothetical protein